jgi:hypothetical protein
MLKAVAMSNKTSPCGGGGSSRFVADGGCVALVEPNLNISMGIATWLFDSSDTPLYGALLRPNSSSLLLLEMGVAFTFAAGASMKLVLARLFLLYSYSYPDTEGALFLSCSWSTRRLGLTLPPTLTPNHNTLKACY